MNLRSPDHSRRQFLRAAGALVALPFLPSLCPQLRANPTKALPPKRFVAIHVPLGMMPQFFFPKKSASSTAGDTQGNPTESLSAKASGPSSPYLDLLSEHQGQFTVFQGMSHPEVDGNHHAAQSFLTGARHPGQPTYRNSISLDQLIAERIGLETRFPFLALSVKRSDHYSDSLAVSRAGVSIPAESSVKRVYRNMFVAGTPEEKAATMRRFEAGGSVLDLVMQKSASLGKNASAEDRARMDQYCESIRELEKRLKRSIEWEHLPKPSIDFPEPNDISDANLVIEKSRLMFEMIRLALQSDSTRVITLSLSTFSIVPHVPGVKSETHQLTHHGNEPDKIEELRKIEEAQVKAFGEFLASLRKVGDDGGCLLDHTQVLYGSCLGNANSHSNQNLPLILAGGGFRHPGLLQFDESNNEPMARLFVSMLQRLGIEENTFAGISGPLRGLEA
jgi:hypothetical protein